MKNITIDNYLQFKPSEFIRSFVSDVNAAIKMGKPMDMNSFVEERDNKCLPCLGGMACLNMGIPVTYTSTWVDDLQESIAFCGDGIRTGDFRGMYNNLQNIYPKLPNFAIKMRRIRKYNRNRLFNDKLFSGKCSGEQLKELQKRIHEYANTIESWGY